MGYIVFTYTFHLWGDKKDKSATVGQNASSSCRRKMMSAKNSKSPRSRISAGLLMFRRRNNRIRSSARASRRTILRSQR